MEGLVAETRDADVAAVIRKPFIEETRPISFNHTDGRIGSMTLPPAARDRREATGDHLAHLRRAAAKG